MEEHREFMRRHRALLIAFAVIILVQVALGFLISSQIDDWSHRGTFGDMFGAVNTLFSGLAFCGVIYAIFLQSKELEMQRLMQKESVDAQNEQAKLMLLAAKISAVSAKLDTFKTLDANKQRVPDSSEYARSLMGQSLKELNKLLSEDA